MVAVTLVMVKFCVCTSFFRNETKRTKIRRKTVDPRFDEAFHFEVSNEGREVASDTHNLLNPATVSVKTG